VATLDDAGLGERPPLCKKWTVYPQPTTSLNHNSLDPDYVGFAGKYILIFLLFLHGAVGAPPLAVMLRQAA